jgi:hypothetical protein
LNQSVKIPADLPSRGFLEHEHFVFKRDRLTLGIACRAISLRPADGDGLARLGRQGAAAGCM